eukprot:COSAG05_NODE_13005_length_445_cov_0.864162_1_plen_135_part_10
MAVSLGGMKIKKGCASTASDFSLGLGSECFSSGRHEWTLKLELDTDGACVGICTGDVNLDRDARRLGRQGACWYWTPRGEIGKWGQSSGHDVERQRNDRRYEYEPIKIILNMDEKRVEFFSQNKVVGSFNDISED